MTFDPSQFLDQPAGPMSTQLALAPEGEWTMVISTATELKSWFNSAKWTDKETGQERTAPVAEIPLEVVDQRAKDLVKRDKIFTRLRFFLDMTPEGKLDTSEGKNVKLGQLRAALGQNNDPSWTLSKLWGAGPFIGKVSHTTDKKDPTKKYAEVTRVSKLS